MNPTAKRKKLNVDIAESPESNPSEACFFFLFCFFSNCCFCLAVLGFQLRTSGLLDSCSTAWATAPTLLCFSTLAYSNWIYYYYYCCCCYYYYYLQLISRGMITTLPRLGQIWKQAVITLKGSPEESKYIGPCQPFLVYTLQGGQISPVLRVKAGSSGRKQRVGLTGLWL
jgi:hypothetical protein